ncbi:MAG: anti-sigma factor family protein [Gemmatimonadales bacterium]
MSEPSTHPGDALQLLLDGRLSEEQRDAVEAHLRDCDRCRRELEAMRQVKAALREDLPEHPLPSGLTARVSAALAGESVSARAPRVPRRAVLVGLALAAVTLLAVVLVARRGPDLIREAARDFAALQADRLELDLEITDPPTLEDSLARRVSFPVRVFDYGMMGYRLAGGGVEDFAGRISTLFAYRSDDGRSILCRMYEGEVAELPSEAEVREQNGIRFYIYRRDGLTLVFWQEGTVVCVFVTDVPFKEALPLAYAKAVKI